MSGPEERRAEELSHLVREFLAASKTGISDDGEVREDEKRDDYELASSIIKACKGLGKLRSLCSPEEFERILLLAHNYGNRWSVMSEAFAEIGTSRTIGRLIFGLYQSSYPDEVSRSKSALITAGKKAHVYLLRHLAEDRKNREWWIPVRRAILDVLAATGDGECIPTIEAVMRADSSVHAEAQAALAAITGARGAERSPTIEAVMRSNSSGPTEAQGALAAMTGARDAELGLHLAATKGDTGAIQALLAKGRDVNERESRGGATPLHMAASSGQLSAAGLLLDNGAEIDARARDKEGWTPLHAAAHRGQAEMIAFLISRGASTEAQDKEGWTPLHAAVDGHHATAAEQLLKGGAKVDARAFGGGATPLIAAAATSGATSVARVLVEHGANIEARDSDGGTPLLWAAFRGNADTARLLLGHGADRTATTRGGMSVRSALAQTGNASLLDAPQSLGSSRTRQTAPAKVQEAPRGAVTATRKWWQFWK
jgi:ankyrin repeat protein